MTNPKVSIIIPCRNEEQNIPRLLYSLKNLATPAMEIIVVDDESTDQTRALAESHGVIVLNGSKPPDGWNGKNWACHQAQQTATGDLLLFTDADTEHAPDSLKRAVSFFLASNADMMSALPYHRTEKFWEKLLGPFFSILYAATAVYSPHKKRLFAIGQYLMFTRSSYTKQGGHAAVFNQYPDDLALANACLTSGGQFRLFTGAPLFNVRMYSSLQEFIKGWRRNFLAGIQQSNLWATIEVFLIFFGVTGGGHPFSSWPAALPALVCAAILLHRQKTWGAFSPLGVFLAPFSLFLFCLITALALADYLRGNILTWKGRSYSQWVNKRELE